MFAMALCLFSQSAWAVPAYSAPRTVMQPDGTEIQVVLQGDEWFSWRETTQKEIVILNTDTGYIEYATIGYVNGKKALIPSGIVVTGKGLSNDKTSQKGKQFLFSAPSRNELGAMWKEAASRKNFTVPYKKK